MYQGFVLVSVILQMLLFFCVPGEFRKRILLLFFWFSVELFIKSSWVWIPLLSGKLICFFSQRVNRMDKIYSELVNDTGQYKIKVLLRFHDNWLAWKAVIKICDHETMIGTGIICKKILLAYDWGIVENSWRLT